MITKKQAIEKEIIETEAQLEFLKKNLAKARGMATKPCTDCGTNNYHYYAKGNNWGCAFCGSGETAK